MRRQCPGKELSSAPVVNTAVSRRIDLEPRDWMRATWRPRQPLPRPAPVAPVPFDRAASLRRLEAIPVNSFGRWQWERLSLADPLSREEAHFWLVAILQGGKQRGHDVKPRDVATRLAGQSFNGRPSLNQMERWFEHGPPPGSATALFPVLRTLLTPLQVLHFLRRGPGWPQGRNMPTYWNWPTHALDWFARDVFPFLTNEEREEARAALRPQLRAATWPDDSLSRPDPAFHLGALVGLHEEMLAVVTSVSWGHDHYHRPQDIVFGLGSAALVVEYAHRLRLELKTPEHVRAWLAHTELSALDYVRDRILKEGDKTTAAGLAEALALVKAPEAAALMLELRLSSKAPQVARRWLEEEVGNAVAGLLPVAAGSGALAEAALDYLHEARRKGHAALLAEQVQQAPAAVADKVRRLVLDRVEKVYAPFDATSTPNWLRTAVAATPTGRRADKLPAWAEPQQLPPLVVGACRLSDEQTRQVLTALKRSPPGAPLPLVAALKQHADGPALEAFAWRLYETWAAEGGPAKDSWALAALGHWGGAAIIPKLEAFILSWPSRGQGKWAAFALECLAAIGSAEALAALGSIARTVKFKGIRQKAGALLSRLGRDAST